jgi:cyclopropane-fatty-acyl-phospholipid synthase
MTHQTERVGGMRTAVWRRIAEAWAAKAAVGTLTLVFPDGSQRDYATAKSGPSATIKIHRGRAVWRMMIGGELGFAEAFMDGDWSSPDLAQVIEFGLANQAGLAAALRGSWLVRAVAAAQHWSRANTRAGSRRNIAHHYDLGNNFFERWLDETMTYSSAVFAAPGMSLAEAQREKYRRVIASLDLRPDDRVLEIGCGWGGFAEIAAAEAGVTVTGITLSREQAQFARHRMIVAGLNDRVDIRVEDYRDVGGSFDRIVAIEMFEAVGERNWPGFFHMIRDRLKDGGRAVIQVITIADEHFDGYRRSVDFIQRYIFPGGMLPSRSALAKSIEASGLSLVQASFFGESYAETLRQWNKRFQGQWDRISPLGFDDRFHRMWTYYLNSCEAGFRLGITDVGQFVIGKP